MTFELSHTKNLCFCLESNLRAGRGILMHFFVSFNFGKVCVSASLILQFLLGNELFSFFFCSKSPASSKKTRNACCVFLKTQHAFFFVSLRPQKCTLFFLNLFVFIRIQLLWFYVVFPTCLGERVYIVGFHIRASISDHQGGIMFLSLQTNKTYKWGKGISPSLPWVLYWI